MQVYRRVIKLLTAKCPPAMPVKVRRVRTAKDLDGDCAHRDTYFYIRINRTLPEHEAIWTLLHEWAHTLAWNSSRDVHCSEWGKAYSRVYRTFLKECLDRNPEIV